MRWWEDRAKSGLVQSDEYPPWYYLTWQRWRVLGQGRKSLLLAVTLLELQWLYFINRKCVFFFWAGKSSWTSTRSQSLSDCPLPRLNPTVYSGPRAVADSEIFRVEWWHICCLCLPLNAMNVCSDSLSNKELLFQRSWSLRTWMNVTFPSI